MVEFAAESLELFSGNLREPRVLWTPSLGRRVGPCGQVGRLEVVHGVARDLDGAPGKVCLLDRIAVEVCVATESTLALGLAR